jgi:hypothetical protein
MRIKKILIKKNKELRWFGLKCGGFNPHKVGQFLTANTLSCDRYFLSTTVGTFLGDMIVLLQENIFISLTPRDSL